MFDQGLSSRDGAGPTVSPSLNSTVSLVKKTSLLLSQGPCIPPPAAHSHQDLAGRGNHEADWSEGTRLTARWEFASSLFYCKAFFLPQPALENLISGPITTPIPCPG